jgi:gas vesicle protein
MAEQGEHKGHGPGFLLGAVVGALAGAVAAILLTPPDEEQPSDGQPAATGSVSTPSTHESPPAYMTAAEDESLARVRAMLERVRARMREAGDAGRDAAQEQERALQSRYAELTGSELPGATSEPPQA